jgi:hypothetical protein
VSHPSLYGWNFSYALASENGPDVPPQAVSVLQSDPKVAAFSGVTLADPQIDGQTVPAIFESPGASVSPPLASGRTVQANDEIVLGAATMAMLHTHVGGTVVASYGSPKDAPVYVPPVILNVVGTAIFPAIGFPSVQGDHTSMGTGALVSKYVIPPAMRAALEYPYPQLNGPEFVFVRMKPGVSTAAAMAEMKRVAAAGNQAFAETPNGAGSGDTVSVFPVQKPAEIVNYHSTGATPLLLAAGLAVGAIAALGLTLTTSVRRRRRDLAVLKTIGFTRGQLSTSVAVQATVIAVVGLVVGVPLGIVVGRWAWVLFARQIYAVPQPTVPALWVAVVVVGALVLTNAVAATPGRAAARTPTALVLRDE